MSPFNHLLFLPLDLPLIPNKNKIINHFVGDEKYVWWKQETLLGETSSNDPLGSKKETWNDHAKEKYPQLIEYINNELPFDSFIYVRLARAMGEVPPHVDENYETSPFPHHKTATKEFIKHLKANEPVGYRFIIHGERDTFYLCDKFDPTYRERVETKKHHCTLPEETDFFLIHNSQQPHGVSASKNVPEDRIVGFVLGFLNQERHQLLIEKSLMRYNNFCVTRETFFGHSPANQI